MNFLLKVNHFPGSFQIGRKDRLWRNLSHMQAIHSRREFDFVPQTFVLPADLLLFKRVFDEIADTKESKWIIKPVCIRLSNFFITKIFFLSARECSRSRYSSKSSVWI
jgi:hypothetical protein